MDRFDAMRLFTRIVERQSFNLAASDLGVPRSTATQVIRRMEERLGVRLFERTTRVVRPTLDGEAYYRRCLSILNDLEDAEGAFAGALPKGPLRVEVQGTLARRFLVPRLPDFLADYPGITLSMTESDRWVDVVQEGVDCVLRWGALPNGDLVVRSLGSAARATCAAPDYLERFGRPGSLKELEGHRMVGIRSLTAGQLMPLEFQVGETVESWTLPMLLSVTAPDSYLSAVRLGFGLAQLPWFHIEEDVRAGNLVAVLQDTPPPPVPISLLHARSRQLAPRMRVFIDWLTLQFEHGLETAR